MTAGADQVGVVIPCYKVTRHILGVIARIGAEVARIYVVDDCCPDGSGDFVAQNCADPRVTVLRNEKNQGVGGAVIAGYRAGAADGMDILVKVDGDGQMDPALIPHLVAPILAREADYTKGNRFFTPEALEGMPIVRIIGNAGLSFLTKLSSGYWEVLDPTNGFTALHASLVDVLPLDKLAKRYFFESDLLFRLNTIRAVVVDVPMISHYADEHSNMHAGRMLFPFLLRNLRNFFKRVAYSYFLRGFSFASFCLLVGTALFTFGAVFGAVAWWTHSAAPTPVPTPTGTIMLSAVPLITGFQLIMGFFAADIAASPRRALHTTLSLQLAKPLKPYQDAARIRGA